MVTAAKLRPAMDIEWRFPQRSAISTARAGTDVAHRPRPQQRSRFATKPAVFRGSLEASLAIELDESEQRLDRRRPGDALLPFAA
jgi:hypothetical protein